MRIQSVEIRRVRLPLATPYVLSYSVLRQFDVVYLRFESECGRVALAEAVALPGYGAETADQIEISLQVFFADAHLRDTEAIAASALARFPAGSFAGSAVITALEILGGFPLPDDIRFPALAAISTEAPEVMIRKATDLREQGYRTLKVKVGGGEPDMDIDGACALLSALAGEVRLRFDANQGYDLEQARRFCDAVAEADQAGRVDYLEQPLPTAEWDHVRTLADESAVPIMLDESIVEAVHIERAVDCGVDFVKLKLCKCGGPQGVLALAKTAVEKGLRVVFGNGVASDVGCLIEAGIVAAAPARFYGAFEGVGLARQEAPYLQNAPRIDHGDFVWTKPDEGRVWAEATRQTPESL